MTTGQHIQCLPQEKIDKKKWDNCIDNASNSLIYAASFYLDITAKQWDALVLNDYEAVMPLPCRKKWGIDYFFQPFLTPVLGVFGKNLSEKMVDSFLETIPSRFKLWDISLNHFNSVSQKFQRRISRNNYVLSLAAPSYDAIATGYSENILRNIAKAKKAGCLLKKNIPVAEIIAVCKREWPKFTDPGKNSFENLLSNFPKLSPFAYAYGVYHPGGKLLSSCVFLIYGKRAYYWLVGNDPGAKDTGASPMLIDQFIQDHAGKDIVLDFEGSDKDSVAEFYRRFGAKPEPYTTIYNNRLPFPFSLLKKMPAHYRKLIS
jgi:hypothetical protein